jgi:hypothetical protein
MQKSAPALTFKRKILFTAKGRLDCNNFILQFLTRNNEFFSFQDELEVYYKNTVYY